MTTEQFSNIYRMQKERKGDIEATKIVFHSLMNQFVMRMKNSSLTKSGTAIVLETDNIWRDICKLNPELNPHGFLLWNIHHAEKIGFTSIKLFLEEELEKRKKEEALIELQSHQN